MHQKQERHKAAWKDRTYHTRRQKELKKLREYEKTGLTPEQIVQMDKMYADKCRELAEKTEHMKEDVKQTIAQLENLYEHCKCMVEKEEEGAVWESDCKALESAIEAIKRQNGEGSRTQEKKQSIRLYLSGPISGTDDYMERFAEAEEELAEQGYNVINPAKVLEGLPADFAYEEYMTLCMGLLTACDAIYMMEGWRNSIGSNREYGYALARGMNIADMDLPERMET